MMKKMMIVLIACVVLLSGCSKKDEPKAKNVDLKALMTQILENTEFEIPATMEADEMMLDQTYGIKKEDVKQFAMAIPLMNVKATEIIMVEVNDGKMDAAKAGLDARMQVVEDTWATYLPAQKELVDNRKTYTNGNYHFIVIAEKADAIIKVIEEAFK